LWNPLDAVSSRDFVLETLSTLSILMSHLSRLAEEIILWNSQAFSFIRLNDAHTTGSSMMPQKKNPDVAELVRGKTGRVYGHLMSLLTVIKALPLAYNKDMQEDKEAVFDTIDTVLLCLAAMTVMMQSLQANPETMRQAAQQGFINATDLADYLVRKGLSFREAYALVGQVVAHCIESAYTLESLPLEQYQAFSPRFESDLYTAISLETCLKARQQAFNK
jgi:argininosuccinate lyase